jgi:GNAT superfamily N-acetyltransferase
VKGTASLDVQLKGYYPGVLGEITKLHAVYYAEDWGFDISFETQVGKELAEFMMDFRDRRDGFWSMVLAGECVGAAAIDGCLTDTLGARLRWFIVRPGLQGEGIGGRLLDAAVDFCRTAGHRRVFLWTFQGLDQARYLYEKFGFVLTEEHEVEQWGTTLKEQKFELTL